MKRLLNLAGALGKAALIMLMHPVWSVLSQWNLGVSPKIPWAAVVIVILLVLLWAFLDGRLATKSAALRHSYLKWRNLPATVWTWGLTAGGLAMVAMSMIETNSCRIGVTTNSPLVGGFAQMPLLTGIAFVLATSAVAAFVEEAAFRGYMQSDLERNFGKVTTFAMVAVAFAVFHLYGRTWQQWSAGLGDWDFSDLSNLPACLST